MPSFWETALFSERDDGLRLVSPYGGTLPSANPSAVPRTESLFEPVRDRYGWRLALVFGNHAPGGYCPYYAGELCNHCDIGAGEGAAFNLATNRERLAWFEAYYKRYLGSLNHLVLYNSGSILNPRELPTEVLDEIIAFANSLPALSAISLDSREAHIKRTALRRLLQNARAELAMRPILGIESADDRIRNTLLRKQMSRAGIERVYRELSQLADEFGRSRIGLDVNIVIAAPGTSDESLIGDAVTTARFALTAGAKHGVPVDLNLHPYYPSARGLVEFPDHPRCSLRTTAEAARRIAELAQSMNADTNLFIGWNDEGHDTDRPEREHERKQFAGAVDMFNHTNDVRSLSGL